MKPIRKGHRQMKTEKFSGTMESAYGQPLQKPIKFDGAFEAFDSLDEVKTANEYPSNDELVTFVNNKRKANARQKAMNAALTAAGIEKPTLEDPKVQYQQMVKVLLAAGKSEDDARQAANALLGTSF